MGYMIQYGPEQNHKYLSAANIVRRRVWLVVLTTIFVAVLFAVAATYRDFLIRCFLPGDAEVTTNALEDLISNFRAGIPFEDAVTTFCREIVGSAAG